MFMIKKSAALAFIVLFLVSVSATAEIKIKSLVKKKWTLVESGNFKIITDLSTKKARLTAEQLEKYRAFCALWLNVKPKENTDKMVVFMTQKSSTWRAMGLDETWVSLHTSREGIAPQMFVNVKGLFGTSFRKPNSGRAVVLNSLTQELFNSVGIDEQYPLWFRTGFAYYLATYTEPGDKIMLGSLDSYRERISSLLSHNNVIRFDTQKLLAQKKMLTQAGFNSKNKWLLDVNRFYMQSFFTVHYFYSNNELRKQMFAYLKAVIADEVEGGAANPTFTNDFKEFDNELRSYSSGTKLMARVMDRAEVEKLLTIPTQYDVSLIDDAQFFEYFAAAVLELGESSLSNHDKQAFLRAYKQRYLTSKDSESVL